MVEITGIETNFTNLAKNPCCACVAFYATYGTSIIDTARAQTPRVWGFSKKKLFFSADHSHSCSDSRVDLQTTATPPFTALSRPSHSSRPIFCCIGEQSPPPTSPDSSPPCASFDAPSVAKALPKLPPWMTIRTLLPISSPVRHLDLHHHLSCAPSAMRSCANLSPVPMDTAMSELI